MYPLAIVPNTYMISFIFADDISAQICTLFLNFVAGGLFVAVVFVMQLVPVTIKVGDVLRFVGLIFPTYCVTHAFIISKDLTLLVQQRQEIMEDRDYKDLDLQPWPSDPWDVKNLSADSLPCVVISL